MIVEPDGWDANQEPLVAIRTAAEHLHVTRDQVEQFVEGGELPLVDCADRSPGRGRPAQKFVSMAALEKLRERMLADLGGCDGDVADERDELRDRVAELEHRIAVMDADELPRRLAELEREVSGLRDRAARLHGALEAGVVAQRAQLDQIASLMLSSGVWDDPLQSELRRE